MGEDRLPINDRMTECAIEGNKNVIDLSADFRLVKPVDVRAGSWLQTFKEYCFGRSRRFGE